MYMGRVCQAICNRKMGWLAFLKEACKERMSVEVLKAGGRRDQVTGNRCSCPDDVD